MRAYRSGKELVSHLGRMSARSLCIGASVLFALHTAHSAQSHHSDGTPNPIGRHLKRWIAHSDEASWRSRDSRSAASDFFGHIQRWHNDYHHYYFI